MHAFTSLSKAMTNYTWLRFYNINYVIGLLYVFQGLHVKWNPGKSRHFQNGRIYKNASTLCLWIASQAVDGYSLWWSNTVHFEWCLWSNILCNFKEERFVIIRVHNRYVTQQINDSVWIQLCSGISLCMHPIFCIWYNFKDEYSIKQYKGKIH